MPPERGSQTELDQDMSLAGTASRPRLALVYNRYGGAGRFKWCRRANEKPKAYSKEGLATGMGEWVDTPDESFLTKQPTPVQHLRSYRR